jgi:hypothetical protein
MTNAHPQELGLLGRLVVAIGILLFVTGVMWHGVTVGTFPRIWDGLIGRLGGPMKFRFILQPSMAAIAAVHDGLKDARAGRSPYLWTILERPEQRVERLREGLNATARIILLALTMDVIYQLLVLDTFYPNEALIVALLFAFVPYLIIRGAALRVARRWRGDASPRQIP